MKWLDTLVNRNKFFRRASLVLGMVLATGVTVQVFTDPPDISMGTAAAYATLVTLVGVLFKLYSDGRRRDDEGRQLKFIHGPKEKQDALQERT